MRTVLLGLLGLALAVTVGLGVHLLTRSTISLPVVRLEPAPALAPPAATTKETTTTARTETEAETATQEPPAATARVDGDGRRQLRPGPRAGPLRRRLRQQQRLWWRGRLTRVQVPA